MAESLSNEEAIITIFGATGKTGSELLKFLSKTEINCQAVTRDLKRAAPQPFVSWVGGDLTDNERLEKILSGCKRIYLALPGNNIIETGRNAIEVAQKANVEHIVYLSTNLANPDNKVPIGKDHAEMEKVLKDSGINWTILRPVGFMQNWLRLGDLLKTVKKERKIYQLTGDYPLSFIDARDIAEVAFTALTHPEEHTNKTYTLTCDKTNSYAEIAEAISQAIGEKVTYIAETPEEARRRLREKGTPKGSIEFFVKLAQAQTSRKPVITTDVQDVLGKPPRSVEQFARDYADRFR